MKKAHITCPYCHAPAQLRPASSIYGIHTRDRTAKLYVCSRYPACDAYVQTHKATGLPMGTLADKSLRQKRMQAHRTFNQLWEKGFMRKQDAYAWLCVRLGIPEADAHIANFSEYRCDQVILLCKEFLNAQRKVKQNGSKQHRVDR